MKNKRKLSISSAIILVAAIVVVFTIVYAGFSQELMINGTATVKSSSWKIVFTDLQEVSKTGTAQEIVAPTISNPNATSIGDYVVTLTSPGDSISYTFDVTNQGSYPAAISSIIVPRPSCNGSGDNAVNDANNVCKYLSYTLKYIDGTPVSPTDTLAVGETRKMIITLTYATHDKAEELPSSDVTIGNLAVAIIYEQVDNA